MLSITSDQAARMKSTKSKTFLESAIMPLVSHDKVTLKQEEKIIPNTYETSKTL